MSKGYIQPMLAARQPSNVELYMERDDWVMERKYNGHRRIIHIDKGKLTAWARPKAGERQGYITTLPGHIVEELMESMTGPITLDGEVLVPDGGPWDAQRKDDTGKVLVVFDVLRVFDTETFKFPMHRRRAILELLHKQALRKTNSIEISTMFKRPKMSDVKTIWDEGGEGGMLKRLDSPYLPGKRSMNGWIKIKRQHATEVTIVGFKKGKRGAYSTVLCLDDDGITVDSKAQEALMSFGLKAVGMRAKLLYSSRTPSGRYESPQLYFRTGERNG